MSSLVWIDHSEKQRRQMLEAVALFQQKDTRDELGVSGIRDTFSDMLFPGTGALQTRARYFFFIPWMYLDMESRRVPSSEIARKVRAAEIALISRLASSDDKAGTIGIEAGPGLQRMPSSIYWNGLKMLGIRLFQASQAQYERSLDRHYAFGPPVRNDDGEVVSGGEKNWHAGLPEAPNDFPGKASFRLTVPEARYLSGRVIEKHRSSLFAFFLDRGYEDADAAFLWDHDGVKRVPVSLRREVDHARRFSELMVGASILYNLYLAGLEPRREQVIADCTRRFSEWRRVMEDRKREFAEWDRADFWTLLRAKGYRGNEPTERFVEGWRTQALARDTESASWAAETQKLIFARETALKRGLARCQPNSPNRAMWKGDAGLGQMDFRWGSAQVILRDIAEALS